MAKKRRSRRAPGTGYAAEAANGTWTGYFPKLGDGYHVRRGFDTRAAAEAWCDSLLKQRNEKLDVGKGQHTVAARIDAWAAREEHERGWKAKTAADVAFRLGYVKPYLGAMTLADVMPDHVDAMLGELRKDLAESSIRHIRNYLWQVFEDAVRRRHITYNPVLKPQRRKRVKQKEPQRLGAAQAAILAQTAAGSFYAVAWWLLICLGLRAGEVCGLRRGDVDLVAGTITIAQEVTDLRGKAHKDAPKNDKVRTLPLPRALVALLAAHLELLTKRAAKGTRAGTWQEHGLVFPGKSGRPMNPTSLRHALKRLTTAASLPPVTTHQLRHTAGALFTDAGCPEDVRAAILGHATATITRHYSPPSVETMRPWVERVHAAIASQLAAAQQRQRA